MKQILAECTKTRQALEEAHFKIEKNRVEIDRRKSSDETNPYDRKLRELEAAELEVQNANIKDSMKGAIRKLAYLTGQYQELLKAHREDTGRDLTEEDYENDEVRYHIMTAFKQAWIAANSRGGYIDEGNLIYMFDLGIPLSAAKAEVEARYKMEQEMLSNGKVTTHKETVRWLTQLADKFSGCPRQFAESRGLKTLDLLAITSG